jgi:hypothetical protein
MRWSVAVLAVFGAAVLAADEKPKPLTFARADLGKLPAGWKAAQTGEGKGSVWKVVADESAPSKSGYVLAQTASGPARLFNLCVLEKSSFKDGTLSVRFKAVGGKIDRGGGLVWRYQDADNYYICRANPLEGNFRLYKVVKGVRKELASADVEVGSGKWHTLKVSTEGDSIGCILNDKTVLKAKGDTFARAGKVGLWTKADAQTRFDELKVQPK